LKKIINTKIQSRLCNIFARYEKHINSGVKKYEGKSKKKAAIDIKMNTSDPSFSDSIFVVTCASVSCAAAREVYGKSERPISAGERAGFAGGG